jgi:hypothetical protein
MKFMQKVLFNATSGLVVMAACIGVAAYHRDYAVTALAVAVVLIVGMNRR